LKACDGLQLFERSVQIRQVYNALVSDSTPDQVRLLQIRCRRRALPARQDEARGDTLLINLESS
jgi:hypothetical protein